MSTFHRWWHHVLARWHAARARKELQGLSDHILKDIGLSRSDIDSMFR